MSSLNDYDGSDALQVSPAGNGLPPTVANAKEDARLAQIPTAHLQLPPALFAVLGVLLPALAAYAPTLLTGPAGAGAAVAAYVVSLCLGVATKPPALLAGSPVLSGALATVAGSLFMVAGQMEATLPEGGFKMGVRAAVAVLAFLTGKPLALTAAKA